MSQPFKRNYLQHALAVTHWMRQQGAAGAIDPLSHILEIRRDGVARRFQPQFVVEQGEGRIGFTPHLMANVSGFVGWLPYFNKTWPIAQDKLAFKELAAAVDMATPEWATDSGQTSGAFIVKARRSTFGGGLRGPFRAEEVVPLGDGEFRERFVAGKLLKAWYWNDRLAVVELMAMPTVRGDGLRTLRQLISGRLAPSDRFPEDVAALAAVQDLSLDSVVPAGRTALADYRYLSVLNPAMTVDHDVRPQIGGSGLEAQLLAAGAHCWAAVPDDRRADTAFTLDGVIDAHEQVWFLEANCNPQLHPAFYDTMLDGIFLSQRPSDDASPSP